MDRPLHSLERDLQELHAVWADAMPAFGTIAGTAQAEIEQPISAATARRMAVDAEFIPAVFGSDSLPLDLGRAARLFTRAQRLALGERDAGCASCGQNIGYVEPNHIDRWKRDTGPTDLAMASIVNTSSIRRCEPTP